MTLPDSMEQLHSKDPGYGSFCPDPNLVNTGEGWNVDGSVNPALHLLNALIVITSTTCSELPQPIAATRPFGLKEVH